MKRFVALLLAVGMLGGALAGCGEQTKDSLSSETILETAQKEAQDTELTMDAVALLAPESYEKDGKIYYIANLVDDNDYNQVVGSITTSENTTAIVMDVEYTYTEDATRYMNAILAAYGLKTESIQRVDDEVILPMEFDQSRTIDIDGFRISSMSFLSEEDEFRAMTKVIVLPEETQKDYSEGNLRVTDIE